MKSQLSLFLVATIIVFTGCSTIPSSEAINKAQFIRSNPLSFEKALIESKTIKEAIAIAKKINGHQGTPILKEKTGFRSFRALSR